MPPRGLIQFRWAKCLAGGGVGWGGGITNWAEALNWCLSVYSPMAQHTPVDHLFFAAFSYSSLFPEA